MRRVVPPLCLLAGCTIGGSDDATFHPKDRHLPRPTSQICSAQVDDGMDGQVDGTWRFTYDIKGDPLEDRYSGAHEVIERYVYDDRHRLVDLWESSGWHERWTYDDDDFLLAYLRDASGDYVDQRNEQDERGRLVTQTFYDRQGSVIAAYLVQYGVDDRASTVLCTFPEGCRQRFEYEYADDGYEMRIRQLDGATLVSDATYQYDREDGALLAQHVEEHFKLDGSEVVRISEDGYDLDDQHRVIARHQRVEQGAVFQAQDSEWRYASDGVIERYIGRYTSNDPQYDDVMLQTYERCD